MRRSTLLLAILLMPTATLADKIVNSDGDRFKGHRRAQPRTWLSPFQGW